MYTTKSDESMWADFAADHPHLLPYVSRSIFLSAKPFYLKFHKWLTCKCPMCHEMDCLLQTFVRNVPTWHMVALKKDPDFKNTRPPDAAKFNEGVAETHCWHCRLHNPLYRSLASPSFTQSVQGSSGLDALYQLCVCEHAVSFGPESTPDCASENKSCAHGCGHSFVITSALLPRNQEKKSNEKENSAPGEDQEQESNENENSDDEEEAKEISGPEDGAAGVKDEAPKVRTCGGAPRCGDGARSETTGCVAYSGGTRWLSRPGRCWTMYVREYQWIISSFIDRSGEHKAKKTLVLKDVSGTRQQFLATFKRKLLCWLPHKRQLLWDKMWQKNRVDADFTERSKNMQPGDVHVRIDFIKNAELHSPHEAQREFFVHQYLSLMCAVVQWKVTNTEGVAELRSQTFMYMSDDRKHDGAFASFCVKDLVSRVPNLPGLNELTTLVIFSDNGPHFAQT